MLLSRDAFLGGQVMVWQPQSGYRAGVDAVLLAAACPARPGDHVLELGCGVGTASLCLAGRVQGLTLTGVERQRGIAELARRNAAETGANLTVVTADLTDLPAEIRQRGYHQVIANPPYFDRSASLGSGHPAREAAMGEDTPLAEWVHVAARRLAPRGWLTMIHRPERLPDLLAAMEGRLGSIALRPMVPRFGRDASLILMRARKDGRAQLRLLSPLILHRGAAHLSDSEDYTEQAAAILRRGAALKMERD